MVQVHFSLKAIQFLVMVLKFYLKILLIVSFYAIEFLINLYQPSNIISFENVQMLYEAFKLVYQLITICVENYCHHQYHQQHLTKVLFFILDFNSLSCELDKVLKFKLRLKCYIESFHIDIILKQNKMTMLIQVLLKNLKRFLWVLQ